MDSESIGKQVFYERRHRTPEQVFAVGMTWEFSDEESFKVIGRDSTVGQGA